MPPKQIAAEAAAAAAAAAAGAPGAAAAAAAAEAKEVEIQSIGTPGLPGFWLGVLEREKRIRGTLSQGDRAALLYLKDIKAERRLRREEGFSISFLFAPNPFFTNDILVKEFIMRADGNDVVVSRTNGTDIHWKEGMVNPKP